MDRPHGTDRGRCSVSENQKRLTLRLNLKKPRHRQAWELLRSRGNTSYTETVVDALLRPEGTMLSPEALGQIRQIFREEFPSGSFVSSGTVDAPPPIPEPNPAARYENLSKLQMFMSEQK